MDKSGSKQKVHSGSDSSSSLTIQPVDEIPRLKLLLKKTNHAGLRKEIGSLENGDSSATRLSSILMDVFRAHNSVEAYTLLYQLNYRNFFLIIFNKIRYYRNFLDPKDILQDVFMSIFRYPHKFNCDKDNAFRNWSYSIIRNTILKHLNSRKACEFSTEILSEVLEDKRVYNPLTSLADEESLEGFRKFYLVYLSLYLHIFHDILSEREKQSLHLVEVEGKRYREACDLMDIKLENFKMIVCRARKKIFRRLNQILGNPGP